MDTYYCEHLRCINAEISAWQDAATRIENLSGPTPGYNVAMMIHFCVKTDTYYSLGSRIEMRIGYCILPM